MNTGFNTGLFFMRQDIPQLFLYSAVVIALLFVIRFVVWLFQVIYNGS